LRDDDVLLVFLELLEEKVVLYDMAWNDMWMAMAMTSLLLRRFQIVVRMHLAEDSSDI
jgi:hypothetical protein